MILLFVCEVLATPAGLTHVLHVFICGQQWVNLTNLVLVLRLRNFNSSNVFHFLPFSVILSYTKLIISHLKIIQSSLVWSSVCVCLCAGFCLSSVFWSRPGWESPFSWTCRGSVTRARSSALTCGGVQLSVPKTKGNDWPTIRTPSRH